MLHGERRYAKLSAANGQRGRMEGSSGNVVLWCEGCGERTTLGDPLSVWRSGRTSFECGCGASLTLSDRLEPGQTSESIEAGAAAVNR
jgi:hypothetical protein